MVSLGPLSPKSIAPTAALCYVHADFGGYASLEVREILEWLRTVRPQYDIIYVSGDTDSFARPRTARALTLLEQLGDLEVDVLFTSRYVFSLEDLRRLERVAAALAAHGHQLFGCVSVAQLSVPHLKPRPIQPPLERLAQLRRFHERGLVAILALRPFLPLVPLADYRAIVAQAAEFGADVILGEAWFADAAGVLERQVFRGPTPPDVAFSRGPMDFDDNDSTWKIFQALAIEALVADECNKHGVPFFMRSRPAIEFIRHQRVIRSLA